MKNNNPPLKINEDDASQFYINLYFEALKRIDRINDIKVSLLKLSLASTFAYFAWLITYHDNVSALKERPRDVIWFIPLAFNIFGFFYNLYLKSTANRFGEFTRYLLQRIGKIHHVYDEFLKEKKYTRLHMSQFFWTAICVLCLILGILGPQSFY